MFRKIMQWIPTTVLLLALTWHPSANYQILLHFVLCAGAVMVILALFFVKQGIGIHDAIDNKQDLGEQITLRLRPWWS
jgi:hypothetical protein